MGVRKFASFLANPRDRASYSLSWFILSVAVTLVVFLAMRLWVDSAIAAAFLALGLVLLWGAYYLNREFPADESEG